jgi:CRISPR-associated exonuclease Cas4
MSYGTTAYGEEPIILSSLNDYLYCDRRCALHRLENIWEPNAHTVAGDLAHEIADDPGYRQTAEGGRIERALPLFSVRLNLIGNADIVEFHTRRDGGSADGKTIEAPMPVDYKRGPRRKWDNDDVQLCAQALCLEEMFAVAVPHGAVYHLTTRRRRPVEFTVALRTLTLKTIADVRHLLSGTTIPPAVLKPQCDGCSLRKTCLPELTVSAHSLDAAFAELFLP